MIISTANITATFFSRSRESALYLIGHGESNAGVTPAPITSGT